MLKAIDERVACTLLLSRYWNQFYAIGARASLGILHISSLVLILLSWNSLGANINALFHVLAAY